MPESHDMDHMPEVQSVDDADMDAQRLALYPLIRPWGIRPWAWGGHPWGIRRWMYRPWMYRPWMYRSWMYYPRRHYYRSRPVYHWRLFDDEEDSEKAPKLMKRETEPAMVSDKNRDVMVENAIVEAQDDQVKLQGLVHTYPTYFYRFYRPVYNRYCYFYPTLYRKYPVYFRAHYPVLYRIYTGGALHETKPLVKFILSSDDVESDEDVESHEDKEPESEDIEPENQLDKRDESFEAEHHDSDLCFRALLSRSPVPYYVLDYCRMAIEGRYDSDRFLSWRYGRPILRVKMEHHE